MERRDFACHRLGAKRADARRERRGQPAQELKGIERLVQEDIRHLTLTGETNRQRCRKLKPRLGVEALRIGQRQPSAPNRPLPGAVHVEMAHVFHRVGGCKCNADALCVGFIHGCSVFRVPDHDIRHS